MSVSSLICRHSAFIFFLYMYIYMDLLIKINIHVLLLFLYFHFNKEPTFNEDFRCKRLSMMMDHQKWIRIGVCKWSKSSSSLIELYCQPILKLVKLQKSNFIKSKKIQTQVEIKYNMFHLTMLVRLKLKIFGQYNTFYHLTLLNVVIYWV